MIERDKQQKALGRNSGGFFFLLRAYNHGVFDLKLINALDNLRPMVGPENLSKADKYDEAFMRWLDGNSTSKI
jgi:hypothetical protein